MAAILEKRKKSYREFYFVGKILNNMEPKPLKKSEKASKKASTHNSVNAKAQTTAGSATKDGPSSTSAILASCKSKDNDSVTTDMGSSSQSNVVMPQTRPNNIISEQPPSASSSGVSQTPNNTAGAAFNPVMFTDIFTNMQRMMKDQMEFFHDMRESERKRYEDGHYDDTMSDRPSESLDLTDDESAMDVCQQIDDLLDESDGEGDTPTNGHKQNEITSEKDQNKHQCCDDDQEHELPELLRELAQDLSQSSATGPELSNEKLAQLLTDMLSKRMPEEKIKQVMDSHPRPANMEYLQAPKTNVEVWKKLKHDTKSRDLRMQKMQEKVLIGLVPLARTLQILTSLRKSLTDDKTKDLVESVLKSNIDSFMLISSASQDLSQRRRDFIKPDLNNQFTSLCSSNNPVTTQLFGDDLPKSMKEISETNKVAYRVSHSGYRGTFRYPPRGRGRGRYHPYHQGGDYGRQNYGGHKSYHGQYSQGQGFQKNMSGPGQKPNYKRPKNFKAGQERK